MENIKILQFGEGNFLRAFADWIVHRMNTSGLFDGKIAIVQPIPHGMTHKLAEQNFRYHLTLKGIDKGVAVSNCELIESVVEGVDPHTNYDKYQTLIQLPSLEIVISNTTEAGIVFDERDTYENTLPKTFPGKVTKLLYDRYRHNLGGLTFLPCELIETNGDKLREAVLKYADLWGLGDDFQKWIDTECIFCNTLVDRIVPGHTAGDKDEMSVEAEIFHLWVIEDKGDIAKKFPADKAGLNVLFVPSVKPYRDRKVTLLNGPHTLLSPVGYLAGLRTVRECIEDPAVGSYVRHVMFSELPTSLTLPRNEIEDFGEKVLERFMNPYIHHQLTSIMLNSFSKFRTRDLPSMKSCGNPAGIILGLAAIVIYYRDNEAQDDKYIIDRVHELWQSGDYSTVAAGLLGDEKIWGEDLTIHATRLALAMELIDTKCIRNILEQWESR